MALISFYFISNIALQKALSAPSAVEQLIGSPYVYDNKQSEIYKE